MITTASAQITDSDTNAFIFFVYHPRPRLVQRNEARTVKLYRKTPSAYVSMIAVCWREKFVSSNWDSCRAVGFIWIGSAGRNSGTDSVPKWHVITSREQVSRRQPELPCPAAFDII